MFDGRSEEEGVKCLMAGLKRRGVKCLKAGRPEGEV